VVAHSLKGNKKFSFSFAPKRVNPHEYYADLLDINFTIESSVSRLTGAGVGIEEILTHPLMLTGIALALIRFQLTAFPGIAWRAVTDVVVDPILTEPIINAGI
jgi:hypothetical protein